jgi:glycosyltransferase involved in cell wall biosynthesis
MPELVSARPSSPEASQRARRTIIYVLTRMIVGGAQETAKYTAEHFYAKGDRVSLVTGPETGSEGQLRAAVPTIVLPTLVRRVSPINDLRALWSLYRLFRQLRPDVVHSRNAKARFLAPLAARLAGVDLVVQTIHGFSFNNEIDERRALYIALERLAAWLCHCNVVVSEADLEEGERLGIFKPGSAAIIRSGVDVPKVRSADPAATGEIRRRYAPGGDTRLVTLVGRLTSPKTPEVFVDAAAMVLEDHPATTFLLVGDGAKREELHAQIGRLGMEGKVVLTGLRSDVPEILAASDITVHSSTHEGLPKTVLEGMAAGTPVVATAVGGVPAVVEHGITGLLVNPLDPDQLAEAISSLLRDPPLCRRLAAAASGALEEFTIERTVADTERLYDRLAANRTPR